MFLKWLMTKALRYQAPELWIWVFCGTGSFRTPGPSQGKVSLPRGWRTRKSARVYRRRFRSSQVSEGWSISDWGVVLRFCGSKTETERMGIASLWMSWMGFQSTVLSVCTELPNINAASFTRRRTGIAYYVLERIGRTAIHRGFNKIKLMWLT